MTADTRSRRYQLTLNNPVEKGFTHDEIKKLIKEFKSCVYWCMCDEQGLEEKTPHTHMYIVFSSAVRFSRIQSVFNKQVHIEIANGNSQQNRDYIRKEGKWEKDKKKETNFLETFEEWGEMPVERQGKRNDLADLYDMIKSGMSNYEIITAETQYLFDVEKIEKARKVIKEEEYKNKWRDIDVHYIYGNTGTGKTRYVMDKYGYENVCKVTNYRHHPFDDYSGQPVILFDEYRSSFELKDMLNYLDGYPLNLPARYCNRVACYTTVYIVSNIPLQDQHKRIQMEESRSWLAFIRRIKDVTYFETSSARYSYDINHSSFYLKSTDEIIKHGTSYTLADELGDISEFTLLSGGVEDVV
ncbi:MAG TPA: replication protein [Ruminococcus sp.]|nr:replication protein [Ruminococcus sp.]